MESGHGQEPRSRQFVLRHERLILGQTGFRTEFAGNSRRFHERQTDD